jgi:hypothetical protein
LLYAGTEFGLYVSFDDGAHWQRFQNNLPVTPVTDLRVHRQDLVVSTQGRAFWILDDLTPLHQLTDEVQNADAWLFEPRVAYRGTSLGGARINYHFTKLPEGDVTLEILDGSGNVLRKYTGKSGEKTEEGESSPFGPPRGASKIPVEEGFNTFNWDLRLEAPEIPEGVVHWGGMPGPPAVPADYQVRMSYGDWSQTRSLKVEGNPNYPTTVADYQKQFDLLAEIGGKVDELFAGLTKLRDVKAQTKSILERMKKADIEDEAVTTSAKELTEKLTEIEEKLTQVKSKSRQDPINFPPMIDNQLTTLYSYVAGSDYQPTDGAYKRFEDLKPQLADLMAQLQKVLDAELTAFNDLIGSKNVPAIVIAK